MVEFEIRGTKYRSDRISTVDQLAIGKRLIPLLIAIGPQAIKAAASEVRTRTGAVDGAAVGTASDQAEPTPGFDLTEILAPLADAVGMLTDEDLQFIVRVCAMKTSRRSGDSWQVVWNRGANDFQFEDINALDALVIVSQVIMDNISNFSFGLPAPLAG